MKKQFILAALVAMMSLSVNAQQVTTLYFLENAPMRHTINPAFQPVSKGYLNFTPLGWMAFGVGNNSLTMSDVLFVDKTTGRTITPPECRRCCVSASIAEHDLSQQRSDAGFV